VSLTGLIQNESENSVTVRPPFGATQTLPRSRVARLQALERSMMPDGLEEGLSLQDMADLLEFIAGTGPARERAARGSTREMITK
jgi:putative heme-binding domain-containing protein